MKQMRGLLIAAVLLAALSGLLYWSTKHKAEEAAKPPADAAPKILSVDDKHVKNVRIQQTGVAPVALSKLAGRWEIIAPEPMPADQDAVTGLVSAAASLTSDRLIDQSSANLAPFGLSAPAAEVTLGLDDGKSRTLQFGADTPAGGATYVKLAGDSRVFTVSTGVKSSIDKSLNDLRDKRVLTFNSAKISRLTLKTKNPEIEFGKNGQNEWQILKPEPMRADSLPVDDLVRKLADARIQPEGGTMPGATPGSTFLLAPLVATVTVTDNNGVQSLEIRQDSNKNTYVKSSVLNGIYKTGADLADAVNKSLADFRNKKLFDFGFSELSQVTAQGATYSHAGEKWFANGKEMDSTSMQSLIEKLRDLTATGFAPKQAGASIFTAGATTRDQKRAENVTLYRDGAQTLAVREGEPTIYVLDNGAADDVIKAAAGIKPASPAPKKK